MQQALQLAQKAEQQGEVPIGAVVVKDNQLIGEGYNQPITACDPSAHAEIVALRAAAKFVNNYRLVNTTVYVTLEPCAMCVGALLQARVQRLVYAAADLRGGAVESKLPLEMLAYNHPIEYQTGLLAEQSSVLLKKFFQARRHVR